MRIHIGLIICVCLLIIIARFFFSHKNPSPHIIIFLADDMGRNDVGLHGSSQISTPNIDALGYNGIVLNRHYTLHICTPSRTALLTGNFPIRSGMQGWPIMVGEPRALPINMPTIAEKLLQRGYRTHLIGKWHLGHENRSVTPTGRGFLTHFGYYNGFAGYFDYQVKGNNLEGFDLHRQFRPAFEYNGQYATDLFTDEAVNLIQNHDKSTPMFLLLSHLAPHTGKNGWDLEVPHPEDVQEKYSYIEEPKRRLYADIVNRLDTSVGRVVKMLGEQGMLDNSILLFMSDNGGQTTGFFNNFASNWPLRGLKLTLFEGGVRNIAVIWSTLLKNRNYIEDTLIHIADWFPTLYSASGGNPNDLKLIDGINHWPLLKNGKQTKRYKDVLLNIDEKMNFSAILSSNGRYKLTVGTFSNGIYDSYFGDTGRSNKTPKYDIGSILNSEVNRAILKTESSSPLTPEIIYNMRSKLEVRQLYAERKNLTCTTGYCLFDLWKDPTETTDISADNPEIVDLLVSSLDKYKQEMVAIRSENIDPYSNPAFCNGSWFTWRDPVIKCEL